jgi:hypothetical protein
MGHAAGRTGQDATQNGLTHPDRMRPFVLPICVGPLEMPLAEQYFACYLSSPRWNFVVRMIAACTSFHKNMPWVAHHIFFLAQIFEILPKNRFYRLLR